ncbi:hypothetical protein [Pseudomonas arsenicoxydans]|uniref:Uncharacterized protein n=1 Tax=Pseudomonas arsenicoxydans TaxID=702115 RepID=A0A502I3J6_9PSED|nr:hypothetical protein [Pseudomonas arsenicoxydans]TPG81441.1 hypothetical protein EAH78_00630 [Pseudomonas arsenicoxydans]
MKIFPRILLLIKVMVMLSLGTSAAWASSPGHSHGYSGVQGPGSSIHAIYADDSDPDGQDSGKSGTEGADEPTGSDDEEGDDQS